MTTWGVVPSKGGTTWRASDSIVKQLSAVIVRLDRTIQYSTNGSA
jgi:hypothetical protein